jgi:hypothetical protein
VSKLNDEQFLYRAIAKKTWIDPDSLEVNEQAFILRFLKRQNSYETGLSTDLVAGKCYQYLNKCFGIIKLSVGNIRALGLEVDNDHHTHVNIINVPHPERQEQQSKDIAVKLAKKATIYKNWLDTPYKK